jgi:hypothetical protein
MNHTFPCPMYCLTALITIHYSYLILSPPPLFPENEVSNTAAALSICYWLSTLQGSALFACACSCFVASGFMLHTSVLAIEIMSAVFNVLPAAVLLLGYT